MLQGQVILAGRDGPLAFLSPRVTIAIAGGARIFRPLEAIVDTAFTGWLTLPPATIQELGLTHYGQREALLASNAVSEFEIYGVLVSWLGAVRPVLVHQSEGRPLIGMALLSGCRLTVDAWDGGPVVIAERPR